MPHPSDPRLLVLLGLRLKGVAGEDTVAEATGLPAGQVADLLAGLADEGLAADRDGALAGWSLTPAGRAEQARLVGAEVEAAGARPVLRGAYERFRVLNAPVLDVCSRWHVREVAGAPVLNDHADPAYDAEVVSELATIHDRAEPLLDDLAGALDRYGAYGSRLRHAVERVESGDGAWFTKPLMPSYHTVWFELHEDLLTTLGLERASESEAASAP